MSDEKKFGAEDAAWRAGFDAGRIAALAAVLEALRRKTGIDYPDGFEGFDDFDAGFSVGRFTGLGEAFDAIRRARKDDVVDAIRRGPKENVRAGDGGEN